MHQETVKFYSNVIDDFIDLLEKEYKSRGLLSTDQIDKMRKSMRQKILDPSKYHKQIVSNFFAKSSGFTQRNQQKLQQKSDSRQEQRQKAVKNTQKEHIAQKQNEENLAIKANSINYVKSMDQQQDDDLNQFKKKCQGKSSNLPKIQQLSPPQHQKSDLQNLYDFSSDDQDQKLNTQELAQIKQKTGIHILGSYNTREKKFNSKKEQTKLTLYNTFFKIHGHDHELLFPVVEILSTRVSKGQVHI